jgi:hypothetical protein
LLVSSHLRVLIRVVWVLFIFFGFFKSVFNDFPPLSRCGSYTDPPTLPRLLVLLIGTGIANTISSLVGFALPDSLIPIAALIAPFIFSAIGTEFIAVVVVIKVTG